ncbi:MAG: hypothetical protein BWY04_01063 [candidate division CPR1 bacterium ADurb.Bin160]|uniref:Uncharacterized protein n=1 Tax=candidate division CPR1 bacterium ADurb.Bin160 TaxID=1852826 RepID=A0A1V5ZLG6_9BACT|nr:MAG: hypothetical protein BWY04_01063 [candidate division CPR1 bacterium ADurb.Bin160]
MDILQEYLNFLNEGKKTTLTKVTRQAKIKRAIGSLSSQEAKKNKDPLYKKMIFHRDMYKKLKLQIRKKYQSRVRSRAFK